jgi:hypothetical protein
MKASARDLLPEFVLGLLPPAQMAEMERLVNSSTELRREVDELRLASAGLADALVPVKPLRSLRWRLLGSVASLEQAPAQARRHRQRTIAILFAVPLITAIGVLGLRLVNGSVSQLLPQRAPALSLLLIAQVTGLWAALRPGGANWSTWSLVSWVTAAIGSALLLASRPWVSSPLTGWICSVPQLLGSLMPLALVLHGLRRCPWNWRRSATAGLALGSTGVVWGEMVCERGAMHVLSHHGGVWVLLLVACLLLSRRGLRLVTGNLSGS